MASTIKFLRKKNTNTTIRFSLHLQAATRDLFSHAAQLDAADCQFSLDGGGFGNTNAQVQESPAGTGYYSLAVDAAEVNGSICMLKVVDATGNAWKDLTIILETYDIYPNPLLETEGAEVVAADLGATMEFDKILGFLKARFLMKTEMTITSQTVYEDDNATPVMAPAVSYDGTTQTRNRGY